MRIVVNTPTGHIGHVLTEALLAAGEQVTVIARSPAKVAGFAARGARVVEGAIDDAATLDRALEGADALFWLTPPQMRPDFHDWAVATARTAAAAAKKNRVGRAVVVSSMGAQTGRGTGPVGALLEVEEAFRAAVPATVTLRPGSFMENILQSLPTIARDGAIYSPLPADGRWPWVATRDIALVAAEELRRPAAVGHRIRGVHGPADISSAEAAATLSTVLGRPVKYVQVTVAQARDGMVAAGLPPFAADTYAEMYQAVLDGRMNPSEARTAETTTPTSFAEFARTVVAPALAGAKK